MKSFLQQSAEHIFNHYKENLDKLVIVLPSQRACFFFQKELAMQAQEPLWSPKITTMEDFIVEASGLYPVDSIELVWMLYDVFKEVDNQIDFERFTGWAYTLLEDFDRIDRFLVDPKQLFEYMSEVNALERWRKDELQDSLQQVHIHATSQTGQYFKFWENLFNVYKELKIRLLDKNQGYHGMIYRQLAENIVSFGDDKEVHKYIFIGLNALSKAEENSIKYLVKSQRAEILWDSDRYYMEVNTVMKAGDQLRKYKYESGYGKWNWQSDHLLTDSKKFHFVPVTNASQQSKVALQIYRNEFSSMDVKYQTGKIAFVLPDENLLQPVLNSLDESIDDFYITMGLSLKNSNLYTLVNLLFELQNSMNPGTNDLKFNHSNIVKVLTHPFIKQYESLFFKKNKLQNTLFDQQDSFNFIKIVLDKIEDENLFFISPGFLFELSQNHPLFLVLFSPWGNDSEIIIQSFYKLIDLLRDVYKNQKNAIETEYLFLFYTIIQRLEQTLLQKNRLKREIPVKSFRLFMNELFRQTRIPFGGEATGKLQIMGMLETRTLDFENVIIFSCNEKTLPPAKRQSSFIPLDASVYFGLPTYQSQESTISYHFYRLLQRAKNVYFLHVLPSDTYGGKEKSRFLYQIENELIKSNPKIKLSVIKVSNQENEDENNDEIKIIKTDSILLKIKDNLRYGISPSQVNNLVSCSLQYYFSNIIRLEEDADQEETIGSDKFGELVHKTLEELTAELSEGGKKIIASEIEKVIPSIPERIMKIFVRDYSNYILESGMNYLFNKVAVSIVTKLLTHQIKYERFPVEILGLERKIETSIDYYSETDEKITVKIKGRADRIDRQNNKIRIVDYKTGKVERRALQVKTTNEEFLLRDPKAKEARQLWLYKYIMAKNIIESPEKYSFNLQENQLVAGIYSLRNIEEGFLDDRVRFDSERQEDLTNYVSESEVYIKTLISGLLDVEKPFEKTTDLETCRFCSYKNICDRN